MYASDMRMRADFSKTVNIRCNNAGALGTGVSGTLAAGDKLTAHWKQYVTSRTSGNLREYMLTLCFLQMDT
jgi:hypothetical protein